MKAGTKHRDSGLDPEERVESRKLKKHEVLQITAFESKFQEAAFCLPSLSFSLVKDNIIYN